MDMVANDPVPNPIGYRPLCLVMSCDIPTPNRKMKMKSDKLIGIVTLNRNGRPVCSSDAKAGFAGWKPTFS